LANSYKPFTRAAFEEIKKTEFLIHPDISGLKFLRDKAGKERDLRELYRGRAPYELLQNADDAGAKNAIFILGREGLAFVHDGEWFSTENFVSLADGWSNKDPSQCIGHKGLGFRSVLDITPSPHLLKVDEKDFFCVRFSWSLNHGRIQEAFLKDPSLRKKYDEWVRYGQSACPIMAIPGLAKKASLDEGALIYDGLTRGKHNNKFTTMFWFPARDPEIDKKVLADLSPMPISANKEGEQLMLDFLKNQVRILIPFLASLKSVRVYKGADYLGSVEIENRVDPNGAGTTKVDLIVQGKNSSESFFIRNSIVSIPQHIKNELDTPIAVKWMKTARISLAVNLQNGEPFFNSQSLYHVYFPTEEPTGTGFVIHGDFYVTPDRKRLMQDNTYNKWLMQVAAKESANALLTQLLNEYTPVRVYEALAVNVNRAGDGAFMPLFSEELKKRKEPFVSTPKGMLSPREVILASEVDSGGFWYSHFADVLERYNKLKTSFLSPDCDTQKSRLFLNLASVDILGSEEFLDLMELSAEAGMPPQWWFECYSFLANHFHLSKYGSEYYAKKQILLVSKGRVIGIPDDHRLIVCMPPLKGAHGLRVPRIFADTFIFLDAALTSLLRETTDSVFSWVRDRFRLSVFEASDLLPRAVRSVVNSLFDRPEDIGMAGLVEIWSFVKEASDLARTNLSQDFWNELGRLPMPLDTAQETDELSPVMIAPAFLCYFPDSFLGQSVEPALKGICGLRRINEKFLSDLLIKNNPHGQNLLSFLGNVGVFRGPKCLRYARVIGRDSDIIFEVEFLRNLKIDQFTGDRQLDENRAVLTVLKKENLWASFVSNSPHCGQHGSAREVLHTVTVIDGLKDCVDEAVSECEVNDETWKDRLSSLVNIFSSQAIDLSGQDVMLCRGGGTGGHQIHIPRYINLQLDAFRWLPTTRGPKNRIECFSRYASGGLISSGQSNELIGDAILPYVVVTEYEDLTKLKQLGVEPLDNTTSSSTAALVRALGSIGYELSSEWGKTEILNVRFRWRLVRGAVQDVYRVLNQREESVLFPAELRLAVKTGAGVTFLPSPWYYAQPGSPIERAFLGILAFIDTDRLYQRLFERMKITRLVPGDNVKEKLMNPDTAANSTSLYQDIVEKMAPYLLAFIMVNSEKAKHGELIVKRLRERFEIRIMSSINLSFTFQDHQQNVVFQKFYLRKELLERKGAIEEARYTLFVVGNPSLSVGELDPDAFGEALAPVFLDGISEEIIGYFPRIIGRYQSLHGNVAAMEEYMHVQLGVSIDAQELAFSMISGEIPTISPVVLPPPPKPKILDNFQNQMPGGGAAGDLLSQTMEQHKKDITDKTNTFLSGLSGFGRKPGKTVNTPGAITGGPTKEQIGRGVKGEEEIMRRLMLPGGYNGLTLIEDRRDSNCGYDFLCDSKEGEVGLEIKTFSENGRVVVTENELQVAADMCAKYYLLGILDCSMPVYEWPTYLLKDPASILLMKGKFSTQTKLEVPAEDLFGHDEFK